MLRFLKEIPRLFNLARYLKYIMGCFIIVPVSFAIQTDEKRRLE